MSDPRGAKQVWIGIPVASAARMLPERGSPGIALRIRTVTTRSLHVSREADLVPRDLPHCVARGWGDPAGESARCLTFPLAVPRTAAHTERGTLEHRR